MTQPERRTIKETVRYFVDAKWNEDYPDGVYVLVNKATGVHEMESTVWPQILSYLESVEAHTEALETGDGSESLEEKKGVLMN